MSVVDSSFESEADSSDILVCFEEGPECFLSDDSRTKTNKEEDVDDRAISCQCGDTYYVCGTLSANEVSIAVM